MLIITIITLIRSGHGSSTGRTETNYADGIKVVVKLGSSETLASGETLVEARCFKPHLVSTTSMLLVPCATLRIL